VCGSLQGGRDNVDQCPLGDHPLDPPLDVSGLAAGVSCSQNALDPCELKLM